MVLFFSHLEDEAVLDEAVEVAGAEVGVSIFFFFVINLIF